MALCIASFIHIVTPNVLQTSIMNTGVGEQSDWAKLRRYWWSNEAERYRICSQSSAEKSLRTAVGILRVCLHWMGNQALARVLADPPLPPPSPSTHRVQKKTPNKEMWQWVSETGSTDSWLMGLRPWAQNSHVDVWAWSGGQTLRTSTSLGLRPCSMSPTSLSWLTWALRLTASFGFFAV